MNDIDEKIRKALHEEDMKAMEALEEESSLKDLVLMSFTGRQAWMSILMWIYTLVFVIAGFYCLYRYFNATELKTSMSWSLGVIVFFICTGMTKMFAWMQMHKQELRRDIKRLELRIISNNKHED